MNCKVVCVDKKPEDHSKLFFGEYGGFIRIDKIQYKNIKKLYEASESNTWFPNEIDYKADIIGWNVLSPQAQRMFKLNIGYQTLMDSGATSLFHELAKVTSLPELQYLYNRIGIEENIHTLTYSNGLDTVFGADATGILDEVYDDEFIKGRIKNEVDGGENFIDLCVNQGRMDDEAKKSILVVLGAIFMLEGIKFPFSFFVTWNINKAYENGIQGFSRALKLIAWDEMTVHTTAGSTILGILRKDKSQGFSHLFEWFDEFITGYVKNLVTDECEYNRYLLQDGEIPGYNEAIGEHVIKYHADLRMKELKLEPIYNEEKSDIIDWYNKYRDLNSTSTALQEADATNYQKGKLVNDLDRFDELYRFDELNNA